MPLPKAISVSPEVIAHNTIIAVRIKLILLLENTRLTVTETAGMIFASFVSDHSNKGILQGQLLYLHRGSNGCQKHIKCIACHVAAYRILPYDIQIFRDNVHLFFQTAYTERFLFHCLQRIKETNIFFIDDDQLLKAFLQHLIELHVHNGVQVENKLVKQYNASIACEADGGGNH